jgi:hypothetical protein
MDKNSDKAANSKGKPFRVQLPPIPWDDCHGRRIINSDQVECLTQPGDGCKFMLSVGRTRMCCHPRRLEIASRSSGKRPGVAVPSP